MIVQPDGKPYIERRELAFGQGRAAIAEQFPDYRNPDEIAQTKGLSYYDEIARDPHVAAVFQTRVLAVLGCARAIHPASDTRADAKIAEFVTWNFEEHLKRRGGLDAIAEQILRSTLKNGYGAQEIMWDPQHARGVVVDDVRDRDPERFLLRPDGDYLKAHIWDVDGAPLPPRKFIFSANQPEYENRYGTSLLSAVHWYVWFKRNGFKFWLIFLEKFGTPTVLGHYPLGANDEEQRRLQAALESIQSRTSITVPEGFRAELLEAARAGATDGYLQLVTVCDQQISKAILGQTLTTQEGASSGSYALGKVHADVRGDILIADGKWLDRVLNWTLIPWLVDYNYAVDAYPYIVTETQPSADLAAEAAIDEKLVNMGVRLPQSYFYTKYNRPEPQDGEPVASPNMASARGEPVEPRPSTSSGRTGELFAERPAPQDRIAPADALFASAKKTGAKAYQNAFVLPFLRLAETATDFGAYQDGLNALKRNTDDFSAFFADALVTAQILGRWVMQQRTTPQPPPDSGGGSGVVGFAENDDPDKDEPFLDVSVFYDTLTPERAAAFVEEKGLMTAKEFAALSDEAKRVAFTIAEVEDKRVIALVQDKLSQAIREGWTYEEFKMAATEIFDAYGVMEIADFHFETLFRTNVQSAYNQGAFEMLHDPDVAGMIAYLRYDAIEDKRTCGLCAALDGTTLPMDDPFWTTFWPPNHHRCRCDVMPITQAAATRDGVTPKSAPRTADVVVNGKTTTIEVYPADGFASAPTMGGFEP